MQTPLLEHMLLHEIPDHSTTDPRDPIRWRESGPMVPAHNPGSEGVSITDRMTENGLG